MGRKPIGEKKLPNTEKWKHYQERKNSTEKNQKISYGSRSNKKIFIKIQKNIRSI